MSESRDSLVEPRGPVAPEPPSGTPGGRCVDLAVEVGGGAEAVWDAISSAEGISRWFSPFASVEPGEGGTVTVSWDGKNEWKSRITAWSPGVHLRLEDEPSESGQEGGTTLDYHIEVQGNSTVVRVVNAGFPAGSDWDNYLSMLDNGWRFFLWNLKHALERHPGVSRTMISARPWVSGQRREVWDRLFGDGGFGPAPSRKGDGFRFPLDGVRALEGTAVLLDPPRAFAGVVKSLNDGVLHVEMEGSGDRWKMGIWISAYGVEREKCDRVRGALERMVVRNFPEEADGGSSTGS